ncbi:Phage head morphogenesis protein [Azospirillaceae bacterium]
MTPEDLALLRMLRLDGLAQTTAGELIGDLAAVLATIAERLAGRTGLDDSFVSARLVALQTQLRTARDALAASIETRIGAALDVVIETTPAAVTQQLRAAVPSLDVSFALVPFPQLRAVKDIPHDGFTWTRWGQKLADGTLSRVESELRQAVSLGEPVRTAAKRLERVGELGRTSAVRLARTALNATANRAQMTQWRDPEVKQYAEGWRFTAILDSRVSQVCAALHGQIFSLDRTDAPFPPRHPNCRSSVVLVFKEGRFTRAHYEARGSGEDWLRGLPPAEQREILGASRFQAFQRGVTLGDMVTYDKPLAVADLKRLYPEQKS